ncbi:MAG: VWA domain-containing protein [Hormoscilla sp.]
MVEKSTNFQTKFILYNLAGQETAYYLVDRYQPELEPDDRGQKVAHSIIIVDRSASMDREMESLKTILIKLLTLEEYSNLQLVVSLISSASPGDVTCHFQRVPIASLMEPDSPYLKEVQNIQAQGDASILEAMAVARGLLREQELTAITLHSNGNSPSPAANAIADLYSQQQNVFVNAIAYSEEANYQLLAKIANSLSGTCIKAGNIKEIYDALYNSMLLSSVATIMLSESLSEENDYQVFVSGRAKKINGAAGGLKILGLKSDDDGLFYKYRQVPKAEYDRLTDVPVAQTDGAVFAFAKANLAEGKLNTAKYALASTWDGTLTAKHAKALTNGEIMAMARDLDRAIFNPEVLQSHEILSAVSVNENISLLEAIALLQSHKSSIILNLKQLQSDYTRRGIKRIPGQRDKQGNLVKPSLQTAEIFDCEYVQMGDFEINRNTATINLLLTRPVKLVASGESGTEVTEVAGVLTTDLKQYNNYTIVSDGELNVKSLRVKFSNKKVFALLKERGLLDAAEFDFRAEYDIQLEALPLVPLTPPSSSMDGVFDRLAKLKVISSIISACLQGKSDVYVPEQLSELKSNYLSKHLNINFPTTTAYSDFQEAIVRGEVSARVSYKIDLGNRDILNLGKLYSANRFLDRMYEVYREETGEQLEKPTFAGILDEDVVVGHRTLSRRMQVTKVDELMRGIFDDFLGLEDNGILAAILSQVGADRLAEILPVKGNSEKVDKEELVSALTEAKSATDGHVEQLYRDKISPLVFYIGATGLLPDEMNAVAQTAGEISAKYSNLKFSKQEEQGTFFEVGDSIISVYGKTEYYSTN